MARLHPEDYLRHLHGESARFREVLASIDPAARVPSCPAWDATDLLWHLGTVQHFWAAIVAQRPQGPDDYVEPPRPADHASVLEFFDAGSARLLAVLAAVDPADEAWTWSADHTVGFILRRQAHEALIHRLDAEQTAEQTAGQTAGPTRALDRDLAADGVLELLEVMYGGEAPPWGRIEPSDHLVRVELTDLRRSIWTRPGTFIGTDPETGTVYDGPHVQVVEAREGEADAVVAGAAADLDAWLWRRRDDRDIVVRGDPAAYAAFRAAVDQPLE